MRIIDISMTIRENMPVFKNKADRRPLIWTASGTKHPGYHETRMDIDLHTGTHLDAPKHMVEGGDSIDRLDLSKVISECRVLDLTDVEDCIREENLAKHSIQPGEFVLLKTRNSFEDKYNESFISLDPTGAQYLKDTGVCGVGIDALRIEKEQKRQDTHKILFASGIVILEGLRLKEAEAGVYQLYALPLKIQGAEASPVRAVLVKEGD